MDAKDSQVKKAPVAKDSQVKKATKFSKERK